MYGLEKLARESQALQLAIAEVASSIPPERRVIIPLDNDIKAKKIILICEKDKT